MARKGYKPEEIVGSCIRWMFRSRRAGMTEAIRQIGVSEVTYRI